MRKFLIRSLMAGVPFGVAMGVFNFLVFGDGTLAGLVAGALFGISMAAFQRHGEKNPPAVKGEDVLFQSPANHLRGVEGVGGWLMLTDQRLFFRPHRFNIQKQEWSIPLSELIRMEPRRTLGVLPNGLRAVTPTGEERFVVEHRRPWLREVELARSRSAGG